MTDEVHEGYARLPEDLLRDLLDGAGDLASQTMQMLEPALEQREQLRSVMDSLGLITTFEPCQAVTVAGIDGGFAVERTSAVDISLSVAVGVEGLTGGTTHWSGTQYEWWSRVSKHDLETERLARGMMVAQELAVLCDAPHDLLILDGSHLTPVIQLNTALTAQSEELRGEARRVWEKLHTVDALKFAATNVKVIAMPKYDSSRFVCDILANKLGMEIPGDDKYLLGLLLQPGELLLPQQVPEQPWASLHFNARSIADEKWSRAFEEAIEPLKQRVLKFTYFKPTEFSSAYRIEFKANVSDEEFDTILTTLESQITGPFVREPYPQYLADVMAKSVGLGLSALQTAVQLHMSGMGRPEIAELLIHSYRTEGV
jgi:hypothetical protein